ncbi:conserved hypothetical protein [Leishmania braziliensis MHOM/BR/75/M2904]|uniref:Uncharacterized protein n=2 Tax=Leishmania braziliensis TaxID=5660 RepID=A4HMM0_LEIBR|nr:conserved hypothetical protein [Leishmania braziliensis MHOM/BR/75/M2904]KAI5689270.1 hypothetical protein MNV84_07418 [Leishmania braziliensis]CAJ2480253.1 unnamed protein product [Leishmania braziliensis]CAJ2480672.1 unnamed protein product [Leishmania braziliensis]CAM43408.1 conserved hypothetical protein [Leishmania braziliensis MHOM/BR/75/M2904]SYZ69480.1 hypothetical_protein [Leishmania braziliensis MHOM/BR/75/M2904]
MLGRKGNWQAALCFQRPRSLTGLRPSPTPSLQRPPASCLAPTSALSPHESLGRSPALAEVGTIHSITSLAVVLAAPSANVLATRTGPVSAGLETLRHALGTRDAYRIFRALLREQHTPVGARYSELERLLSNLEGEADSLAAVVCACVAVALSPSDWPPWVSARFASTGMASMPIASNRAVASTGKVTGLGEAVKGMEGIWEAASPLRVTATDILRRIAAGLPSQGACYSASSPSLPLLKFLTLLCGVALSVSSRTALHLAAEVSRVSLDAAGVALAAFCASHSLTAVHSDDDSAAVAVGHTRETWWLSLWMQLTQPSAQPPSLPPFSLDAVATSPAVLTWSRGLMPADLREKRVSWHLHCLIASKEVHSAARLLLGTCRDISKGLRCDTAEAVWMRNRASIPVLASTQAEALSSLPPQLLKEDGLGERLALSLVGQLKQVPPQPQRPWSGSPQSISFVPTVAANTVLYARMLQYLLMSSTHVRSEDSYVQHLRNLSLLLSHGSIYALAASLVPADKPLKAVMVATKDTYREDHIKQLVSAIREVVDSLCEEPIPLFAAPVTAVGVTEGGFDTTRKALKTGSALLSDGVVPTKDKRGWKPEKLKEKQALLECAAVNSRVAVGWRWREDVLSEVDGTVQAAVRLLSSLLELCSSRKSSLPLRAAEPKWRRELRERTAVRAHKFELLLQELPHAELRAMLHTLLGHGYIREGSRLGVSLVKGDQMDLRYYTLPLLGSLYLAVCVPQSVPTPSQAADLSSSSFTSFSAPPFDDAEAAAESEKQAVYRMYRRRLEIYGNADLNATAPSRHPARDYRICSSVEGEHRGGVAAPTCHDSEGSAAATTTALIRTPENKLVQALVLASRRPTMSTASHATAELANCLLNRRVVVAGRGMVVDVGSARAPHHHTSGGGTGLVFGPWLHTGTVTW